jgi:hypothetical protein
VHYDNVLVVPGIGRMRFFYMKNVDDKVNSNW